MRKTLRLKIMASSESFAVTRESVLKLMKKKDEIESDIKAFQDVLESQGNVGMHEPLVDKEGYPRSDIDIYTVRHARHQIICLQNDHKDFMNEIENALHRLHAQDREKQMIANKNAPLNSVNATEQRYPFAKVDSIAPGSPAEEAGLLVGDLIVEFGSITPKNFTNMQNIASVVQHSIGRPVSITVRRESMDVHLGLVPKQWSGRGLLGCNIVPITQ